MVNILLLAMHILAIPLFLFISIAAVWVDNPIAAVFYAILLAAPITYILLYFKERSKNSEQRR